MPATRIILLEKNGASYRFALWADVPAARQAYYADPTASSAWRGASAEEVAALRAGAVVESVAELTRLPSEPAAAAKAEAVALWQAYQARITAENPWQVYGSTYDDTDTWHMTGVA